MKKSDRRSITIGLLMSVFIFLCGMSACCPPININGSGPVILLGNVCGEDVNLETRTGGAIASFEQCGEVLARRRENRGRAAADRVVAVGLRP